MSQKTYILRTGGIVVGRVAIVLAVIASALPADDSPPAAAPVTTPGKLIVHEWGTFTSFAGSDGVNLEFRPLVTNDLPKFIMNPYRQPGTSFDIFLKDRFIALQRMETPVTYFYTDVPRVVHARVDFPQGMLSEWYPVAKSFDSGMDNATQTVVGQAYLDWGTVRLTPPEQFADIRVRDLGGQAVPASLPPVKADDHYGRARETDSAIVETVDARRGSHFEKFLFYRGLGNFALPIKLVALGNDRFEVANADADSSGTMLLVRIENDRVRFTPIDPLAANSTVEMYLSGEESTVDDLADAMVRALTSAGLYEKESLAMVNTWRSSWFGENGTRLLYLVPGHLTDKLLPLAIDPVPDETVRVLVGRLETLTPEDSQQMVRAVAFDGVGDAPTPEAAKAQLASLGRFAEPAIEFAISQTDDPTTRARLEAVLAETRTGR
jgi:hypothetical protein